MCWLAMFLILALPTMACAQTAEMPAAKPSVAKLAGQADDPVALALIAALPAVTVKRLRLAPDRFIEEAGVLIYGYGTNGAIDPAGLARFVDLRRASTRAAVLRRFLDADLNNDGDVSAAEIATRADSLAANARGRLRAAHATADLNADGTVSWDEMRGLAQLEAVAGLSATEASTVAGFIGFDRNGDGAVDLAEVRAVVALLLPKT